MKPMFSSVHHDRFNDKIFAYFTDGSRQAFNVKHKFYVPPGGHPKALPSGMVDIYGNEMHEVIVNGNEEYDCKIQNMGRYNRISECDIDFRTRWLENYYKDTDELITNISDINVCFLDIEVATTGKFPEAELAEFPVNCVTIYLSKYKKYYTFGLNRELKQETIKKLENENCAYINCINEKDLLTQLFTKIGYSNVDILSGFNSDWFDIPYLIKRASDSQVNIKLLSRLPIKYKAAYISKRDNKLKIGGTEVIDYLPLYKKFTLKERDNFKLDTIGKIEVGEQKAPLPDGYKSWMKYWDDFVWYNFMDVRLLKRIEDKCRLFETTVSACAEARVPFSAIFETKKMLVGFILKIIHKEGIVMPPLREMPRESFPGAYVYATPDYYENLVSYDYRSMYPSIIIGANISPETKVMKITEGVFDDKGNKIGEKHRFLDSIGRELFDIKEEDLVKSPWDHNGKYKVFYRKDKEGIIPKVSKIIFGGRSELKNKMKTAEKEGNKNKANVYNMRQQGYKIFGNGLYGLLGNPYFQFHDIDNSASITGLGAKLIQDTMHRLCNYFEKDLQHDKRYVEAFKDSAKLDENLFGTYYNEEGVLRYNRLSHGDTDSFFVKYNDIYKEFSKNVDKKVSVYVFNGNKLIHNSEYKIPEQEKESKIKFNDMCIEFCLSWKSQTAEEKKKAFKEGLFSEGNYKVIYNRFCLTDYCRILDACLMEDVLSNIMKDFSDFWNFKENTLFLKREKCITKAIVTTKKKYICNVESNEDVKIFDENERFKITGLEIVRSSTTPFSREYILDLVKELLDTMDKHKIRKKYLDIKAKFFEHVENKDIYPISIPSGISKRPEKYLEMKDWPEKDRKAVDWRLRAASVWNHLIESNNELKEQMLEPIGANSKVKFLKVSSNQYGINSIAYIGDKCPEELLNIFNVNWEEQWEKTFAQVMSRLFVAIGWAKDFEHDQRDMMAELF